jgi:tetratricopeptide (TPR) repeat protein
MTRPRDSSQPPRFMKFIRFSLLILLIGLPFLLCPLQTPAKNDWLRVSSRNFTLIGDAGEKDIRRVATRLEQFRESIKVLFPKVNLDKPLPTVVYVFDSHGSFHPFKPRDRNGKIQDWVGGYFLEGRENAVIALTVREQDANPYEVIFHEFQHHILDNNFDDPPPWLHEGLAEFYSQFKIDEKEQTVSVGGPIARHIYTLRQEKMIPLEKLFNLSRQSKKEEERVRIGIFYAQSWALVHYLMLGNEKNRAPQFQKFLAGLNSGLPLEENFRKSFGVSYAEMEKELRDYIGKKRQFLAAFYKLSDRLNFETEMQTRTMSAAEVECELGKLLLQLGDSEKAEKHLRQSIALDGNFAQPRAWLGSLLTFREKYDEAEKHLAQSVNLDPNYYLAHVFQGDYFARREKPDEAVAAYRRAVDLNPNSPKNYTALASYLSSLEQNAESLLNYSRALRLAPREPDIYYSSSIVALRMRRGFVAALQAQSYLRLKGWDETFSPYAVLVAYFGFRMEKRDADANRILQSGLGKLDKTLWPYSVLRYLNREISSENLLEVSAKSEKKSEAHTFIGLDLALNDENAAAATHFQWVKSNGNKNSNEYRLSNAELERITKTTAQN